MTETQRDDRSFELPSAILDRPIEGCGLRRPTLREELGAGATHVVFLRHFG